MEIQFNPFQTMKTDKLQQYVDIYNDLIAKQKDDYLPPLNKMGKRMKHYKMPWMVKVWQKGLDMVKAELEIRSKSSKQLITESSN